MVLSNVSRGCPVGPQFRSYSESYDVPVFRICLVLAIRGFQRQIQKCGATDCRAVSRWLDDRTNPEFSRRWTAITAVARLPSRRTYPGACRVLDLQVAGLTCSRSLHLCRIVFGLGRACGAGPEALAHGPVGAVPNEASLHDQSSSIILREMQISRLTSAFFCTYAWTDARDSRGST